MALIETAKGGGISPSKYQKLTKQSGKHFKDQLWTVEARIKKENKIS